MAEEAEDQAPSTAGSTVSAAMALGLATQNERAAAQAEIFLREQTQLARLQMEEMRAEEPYKLSHFRLRRFSGWAKAVFEFSAGMLGLAVAAGLAFLVWNAANSTDLVIDSFQVPPEMAAKGLGGPVIAAKLSDKITAMQLQTSSQRAARSYANGLADGPRLEIPETGVSLSELDRFLRQKLGHDLHIGGEMVMTGNGISLTARAGTDGNATVSGAEADTDALLQKLAEAIYRLTQPYRYAVWLQDHGSVVESVALFKQVAANGPAKERAWAYNGWATTALAQEGERATLTLLQRGHALDPDNYLLINNLGASDRRQGRIEQAISWYTRGIAALSAHGKDYTQPERVAATLNNLNALLLFWRGDLAEAERKSRAAVESNTLAAGGGLGVLAQILAQRHELTAATAVLAELAPTIVSTTTTNNNNFLAYMQAHQLIVTETEDWAAAPALEQEFVALTAKLPGEAVDKPTLLDPVMALALAHQSRFSEAEARLKPMPGDCYPCLIARGQVAALQGQSGRTDYWFARAVAAGPSMPGAEAEWGKALLALGKPDEAIAQFAAANKKSPHFADPLEGWGEALMAKNQSHLALAKFTEAEKYAPNWGRLHLKWGEALTYAGKRDEARKQFDLATGLDLAPDEKAELARSHAVATNP